MSLDDRKKQIDDVVAAVELDAGAARVTVWTLFKTLGGFRGAADFDLELIESRTLDGNIQELTYRAHPAWPCLSPSTHSEARGCNIQGSSKGQFPRNRRGAKWLNGRSRSVPSI